MEKSTTKTKSKLMKFLPRAASAVTFKNPTLSPGREKRSENQSKSKPPHPGKGFSGPIVSMIPAEARRKSRIGSSFDVQEPTSPKVSCMGQIKHKKRIKKLELKEVKKPIRTVLKSKDEIKLLKKASAIGKLFHRKHSKKTDVSTAESNSKSNSKPPVADKAPALGQMQRFASSRDAFANFDWAAQIAPVDSDHRNYYSDEDRGDQSDSDSDEDEVKIPFSAPMAIGGGLALEPRKEVNLWKRRTVIPPKPLQLNA